MPDFKIHNGIIQRVTYPSIEEAIDAIVGISTIKGHVHSHVIHENNGDLILETLFEISGNPVKGQRKVTWITLN